MGRMTRWLSAALAAVVLFIGATTLAAADEAPRDLYAPANAVQVLPLPAAAGDALSLRVTARNASTRPLPNVWAKVYLRRGGQDTLLAEVNLGLVPVRGATTATADWAWDTAGLSGKQTLVVHVDPDDRVQVGDENAANNVAPVIVDLGPRPPDEQDVQWTVLETACCTVHTMTRTAAARDLSRLQAEVDEAAAYVEKALGVQLARRLDIYLVPRTIGHGGYASGFLVISYHDRHYPAGRLREVLRHEIVHAAQGTWAAGDTITMMAEGLAVWVTGGHFKPEPVRERAASLLRIGRYTPFSELVNDFYQKQHETGYVEAAGFVQYIAESYGADSLRQVFASLKRERGQRDLTILDRALTQALGKGVSALEADYKAWLEATPRNATQERDLVSTIDFFDTVRRYQQALDPTAYFLTPWLPNIEEAERRGRVADFVRHPQDEANLTLESLLLSAADAQYAGDYDAMDETLRVVKDILAERAKAPETAWADLFGDPLASAHAQIVAALLARGYEPQRIEVDDDTAHVWATRGREDVLYRMTARRDGDGWRLREWVYHNRADSV